MLENLTIDANNKQELIEIENLVEEIGFKKINWTGFETFPVCVSCDCKYMTYSDFKVSGHATISIEGLRDLVAKRENEQGLIGGVEAHKALLAGENVQYSGDGGEEHWDTALNCNIGVFLNQEKFPNFKFRIAPRTIKIELELPKPFEPKENDMVWGLNEFSSTGYEARIAYDSDDFSSTIGYWKTEEEIKQVVAALRGALK